jgi:hypothetical protein
MDLQLPLFSPPAALDALFQMVSAPVLRERFFLVMVIASRAFRVERLEFHRSGLLIAYYWRKNEAEIISEKSVYIAADRIMYDVDNNLYWFRAADVINPYKVPQYKKEG